MLLEPPIILVLAIAAVLAMVGYLLEDLGRAQERSVALVVEREHEDAQLQRLPAEEVDEVEAESEEILRAAAAALGPYRYKPLPEPDGGNEYVPPWIQRELAGSRMCLTLDEEDQAVLVLRTPAAPDLHTCPVSWSSASADGDQGVRVALILHRRPGPYEARMTLVFSERDDLRYAIALACQDELRVDFVTADPDHGLRYRGARFVEIPPEVTGHLRRILVAFAEQEGDL